MRPRTGQRTSAPAKHAPQPCQSRRQGAPPRAAAVMRALRCVALRCVALRCVALRCVASRGCVAWVRVTGGPLDQRFVGVEVQLVTEVAGPAGRPAMRPPLGAAQPGAGGAAALDQRLKGTQPEVIRAI